MKNKAICELHTFHKYVTASKPCTTKFLKYPVLQKLAAKPTKIKLISNEKMMCLYIPKKKE